MLGSSSRPGEEAGPDHGRRHRLVVDVLGLGGEAAGLDLLGAQALDHPHAGHRLLDHGRQLGRLALDAHHVGVEAPREARGQHVQERQRAQGEQGQHRVDGGEDDRHQEDRHAVADGEGDHHHQGLDLLQVGVGPAHELTGLHLVVVGEVQALHVGEQPVAQVGLDGPGLAERPVAAQAGEQRRGDRHAPERDRPVAQRGHVVLLDAAVDGSLDDQAGADLGPGPRQPDRHPDGDALPATPGLAQDQCETPACTGGLRHELPSLRAGRHPRFLTHGSSLAAGGAASATEI